MEHTYEMNLQMVEAYKICLIEQEKSKNTISKYVRDVTAFFYFLSAEKKELVLVNKLLVMEYKEHLQKTHMASSVNSMLVALNGFLQHMNWTDCCVRLIKCQRRIFRDEQQELTKAEYLRLIEAAKKKENSRLEMVMKTICATGIRVSELIFITVEAAKSGRADIYCKGKRRVIFLPDQLRKALLHYTKEQKISSGYIFRTKTGKPLDRSNIWKDMKDLCKAAGVEPNKVFPHNLRHLFARAFYALEKTLCIWRISSVIAVSKRRVFIRFRPERSMSRQSTGWDLSYKI